MPHVLVAGQIHAGGVDLLRLAEHAMMLILAATKQVIKRITRSAMADASYSGACRNACDL